MTTFRISQGQSAPDFQREGGQWEPQIHLTGNADDDDEITAVQRVIDKHMEGVVAYFDYRPYSSMFSLELQFKTDEAGQAFFKEYNNLFTPSGSLKKS